MISIGSNFLFFTRQQSAHALAFILPSSCLVSESFVPITSISLSELSKKDSVSSPHGAEFEAGQGDLKGVLSQVSRISMAESGDVAMPETARTLELLMDREFAASAVERQVAAKTPGNLLAKMETPTPVPHATRPRIPGVGDDGLVDAAETRRPTSAAME